MKIYSYVSFSCELVYLQVKIILKCEFADPFG